MTVSACLGCHLHRHSRELNLVVPMLPRRFHTAEYFGVVKRLRQHVPGAPIQSITPETVVRKSGRDNQRRNNWQVIDVVEHVDPGPLFQIRLAKNYGNLVLS